MPFSPTNLILLAILILMSVVTFCVYGWDKKEAQSNGRRVPEVTLHTLALMGGWPGALLGRRVFRHKTQKVWFSIITFSISILHGLLIAAVVWWTFKQE